MKLEPFEMERMQSTWENRVAHNLSESGVHPMTVEELLGPEERAELMRERLVYVQSNGTEELRAAVAHLHPGARAENVTVANGTAEANFIAAWRLVEPGDEVVLVLPNYMQLWGLVRALGATVVPVRLREETGWGLDAGELGRAVGSRTRLIAVCNPNNPTGAILSDAERKEIVAAAGRHGAWILADEVYRGAERDGQETASLWGAYDRLLVTGGLSKAYGLPGLRVGWVVGPAGMAGELWARKDYITISPGALSDRLARAALRPDLRARILSRTRRILAENYPVLERWVQRRGDSFRLVPPRAGAIAYLGYAWPVNSTELVTRLREEQSVLIVPGDHFGMDGFLRIGFGNEPGELRAGLERIDAVLDRLPAPAA
ncbi:MAG: aspartate aminotransferase [Acidobacteria bacterium]|nr:MAG: aspartate aminotransferase [Acidobacteriota bacterium]